MEVSALQMSVDSSGVVKGTKDLNDLATASERAGRSADRGSGSINKMIMLMQSMNTKLAVIVNGMNGLGASSNAAAVAQDNAAKAIARTDTALTKESSTLSNANAHVLAYAASLKAISPSSDAVSKSTQNANSHIIEYRKNLERTTMANWEKEMAAKAASLADQHAANRAWAASKAQEASASTSQKASVALAQVATSTADANSHVEAYRAAMANSSTEAAEAAEASSGLGDEMKEVAKNTGMGSTALTILGGIVGGVVAVGVAALTDYLVGLAVEMFTTKSESEQLSEALSKVKFATDAVGAAQGILSGVMDLTTGKINTQSGALVALARAQLMVAKVQAQVRAEEAKAGLRENVDWRPGAGATAWRQLTNPFENRAQTEAWRQSSRKAGAEQVENFLKGADYYASLAKPTKAQEKLLGDLTSSTLKNLEAMRAGGKLTSAQFATLATQVANYTAETTQLSVWDDAQRLLDGDTSGTGYLLKPAAAGRKKAGEKSEAEKLADILKTAKAEVAAQQLRLDSVGKAAQAVAELEQRTKLLNAAEEAGINITPRIRAEIEKLATEYSKLKIAADVAVAIEGVTDALDKQHRGIMDDTSLIGKYGDELIRAKNELDALRQAQDALPKGAVMSGDQRADVVAAAGQKSEADIAKRQAENLEKIRRERELSAAAMDVERGALFLNGQALLEYNYVQDKILQAKRDGIDLSDAEIEAIKAAGGAYAQQRHELDQLKESMALGREVIGGFFSDWMTGMQQGGNVFKTFLNSVLDGLAKLAQKLQDKMIDNFLNSLGGGSGGGGGFLGSVGKALGFANGGAFGSSGVQQFAKGGAFTNSIVNTPTLFRFANGGAFGEMGEAGPEAIMPLKRGPDGALGVQSHGGGEITINIRGDAGPLFTPTVTDIANNSAARIVHAGLNEFNDRLPDRMQEISDDPRLR